MRKAGELKNLADAEKFLGFLRARQIPAEVVEGDGLFSVWVVNEDHLEFAEKELGEFLASPNDDKYKKLSKIRSARKIRFFSPPSPGPKNRSRHIDVRTQIFGKGHLAPKPVTIAFIIISVALTLLMEMGGAAKPFVYKLYFSEFLANDFREILTGEVWRLLTPIFLHGGMWHLGFNMLWLYQLGAEIEENEGSFKMFWLTSVLGILCNTAQYMVSGPLFYGMSGVVYGLLGYIWMMTRYQYPTKYNLSGQTVGFMVIWLVICLIGLIPNVANTEHVVGFMLGTLWGFLKSGGFKIVRRTGRF